MEIPCSRLHSWCIQLQGLLPLQCALLAGNGGALVMGCNMLWIQRELGAQ